MTMRIPALLSIACAAACVEPAHEGSPVPTFSDDEKADGASTAACSEAYWTWLNGTLAPLLDQPISEASAADVMFEVANHPDAADDNKYAWNLCYQPFYNKYVWEPVLRQLHDADAQFLVHKSLAQYKASLAPSPVLARNAAAIAALRPAQMDFQAYTTWTFGYSTVLAEAIHPLGIPGLTSYEDVVEAEWVIDGAESTLIAMIESARAEPVGDGCFEAWMTEYKDWLFHPVRMSNQVVFELDGFLGTHGVEYDAGRWYLPGPVRTFVTRFQATRPDAIGMADTSSWMSQFTSFVRVWLSESEPSIRQLDDLKVRTLEEVMPARRIGLHAYRSWLDLASAQAVYADAVARERVQKAKPCVSSADLAAAQQAFAEAPSAILATAAPRTCT